MRPLDQPHRQLEPLAEFGFPRLHFAAVAFVIVAGQVQQPVQDEDLQLGFGGVSQFRSIGGRDLGRYGKITGHPGLLGGQLEAEDVGGSIHVAVLAVHAVKFAAGGDENRDFAGQPHGALRFAGEQGQGPFAHVSRLVN